jgi:hypothetical protein
MISEQLIDMAISHYEKHKDKSFIVKPSLPILYFGNMPSYVRSETKVLTVGKNPSYNEFRLANDEPFSFIRFPNWNPHKKNLIESINPYFEVKPLQWFSCYEPMLNGIGASYKEGQYTNIALHTDICSPLATSPTWSKLRTGDRESLFDEGEVIWRLLIEELQPDIMLASIPRQLIERFIQSKGVELTTFETKADNSRRSKPYPVYVHDYVLGNDKHVKVVYGQAAQKPFGTISDQQKRSIGKLCLCRKTRD